MEKKNYPGVHWNTLSNLLFTRQFDSLFYKPRDYNIPTYIDENDYYLELYLNNKHYFIYFGDVFSLNNLDSDSKELKRVVLLLQKELSIQK